MYQKRKKDVERKTLILLIVEAVLFAAVLFGYISSANEKETIYEQNLTAAHDTIEVYRMKNNEMLYEKSLYIQAEEDLMKQLNMSKNEIKELKKKVGDLEVLAAVGTTIKVDTIHSTKDSIIYVDNGFRHKFEFDDEWISINGLSWYDGNSSGVDIYDIYMEAPLNVGVSEDYKLFITSKNPYVNITSIEGSILENSKQSPTSSKWGIGIGMGFGFQYGLIHKELDFGPQFGIEIQYKF